MQGLAKKTYASRIDTNPIYLIVTLQRWVLEAVQNSMSYSHPSLATQLKSYTITTSCKGFYKTL